LPSGGRRSRIPQLLLAAVFIIGGGLGGLLLFSRYDERQPVVVLAADLNVGSRIERQHLTVSTAALDGDVTVVTSIDAVVGSYAAHDLRAGDLVSTSDLVAEGQRVSAEESVVGLLLEPGAYPTRDLAPGDRVDAYAAGAERDGLVAADLVVLDVVESSNDGRMLLVSIVAPSQADAARLVDEDTDGGIRLTLRGEG
jgi:hypothetical protein